MSLMLSWRRTGGALLFGLLLALAVAGPARAAKTYNDPWVEGDLQQIHVPQALDILARTPVPVIVGDIDSGAKLDDPDLAPHLLRMTGPFKCLGEYGGTDYNADPIRGDFGCDFIGTGVEDSDGHGTPTTAPDGDPTDPFGHGTGSAAIIAAVPNNGIEGAGVAPNARVLPIRACYGGGPDCFNEPALDGMVYAFAMGATVINASWPPGDADTDPDILSFIRNHPEMLFDFAIGGPDQNSQPYTPLCTDRATYPNVICVGLANPDDSSGTDNSDQTSDVSAPGGAGVPAADGSRSEFGYTSGATAHVSGAAALLRGLAPDLDASTIRQVLVSTSRPVDVYQTANRAHGIIDVAAAVRAVQQMEGLTTPAEGQGAPADTPDPFAGQTGGPTGTPPGTTPPGTKPGKGKKHRRPSFSLGSLPTSVVAGASVEVHVRVRTGRTTIVARLTRGKVTLAKAVRRHAHGRIALELHLGKHVRRGRAKLSIKVGQHRPRVQAIKIIRHHRHPRHRSPH